MATAAEPLLLTVEQYRQLPNREDVIQELHWGQVVTLTQPKMSHTPDTTPSRRNYCARRSEQKESSHRKFRFALCPNMISEELT